MKDETPKLNPEMFRETPDAVSVLVNALADASERLGCDPSLIDDAVKSLQFETAHWKAVASYHQATMGTAPLSPVVLSFARKMQERLDANMHKGTRENWRARSGFWLQNSLAKAAGRLASSLETIKYAGGDRGPTVDRAVDLATYALIAADACGGLDVEK